MATPPRLTHTAPDFRSALGVAEGNRANQLGWISGFREMRDQIPPGAPGRHCVL
ncbi:MAG: hypothetical protein H0X73_06920 [Chthoniobacterales bacterium]|nr:hypothetical protein [Chthoniobacterales bacterium]